MRNKFFYFSQYMLLKISGYCILFYRNPASIFDLLLSFYFGERVDKFISFCLLLVFPKVNFEACHIYVVDRLFDHNCCFFITILSHF